MERGNSSQQQIQGPRGSAVTIGYPMEPDGATRGRTHLIGSSTAKLERPEYKMYEQLSCDGNIVVVIGIVDIYICNCVTK